MKPSLIGTDLLTGGEVEVEVLRQHRYHQQIFIFYLLKIKINPNNIRLAAPFISYLPLSTLARDLYLE